MKLLELEVDNIRGIVQTKIVPNGKSIVIWGPNGVGKSAIIDAIDFLLTGNITRLSGQGTGSIKLEIHGPHLGCAPEKARVRAIVKVSGSTDAISLERCMDDPLTILCQPETAWPLIAPIIELAQRRQHMLTRREILRYITASPSSRAQGIQELLNLTNIENIRAALVTTANKLKDKHGEAKRALKTAESDVTTTLQIKKYKIDDVVMAINEQRAILGGVAIPNLSTSAIKQGLQPPNQSGLLTSKINPTILKREMAQLKANLNSTENDFQTKLNHLKSVINQLLADSLLMRQVVRQNLLEIGLSQLDDSGICPLCDNPWEPSVLRAHLEAELKIARDANEKVAQVKSLSVEISNLIKNIANSLHDLLKAAEELSLDVEQRFLSTWQKSLNSLANRFEELPTEIERAAPDQTLFLQTIFPSGMMASLDSLEAELDKRLLPRSSTQTAWDVLTGLEANLKALERATLAEQLSQRAYQNAQLIRDTFTESRDQVLNQLYANVQERFVKLYRLLHGEDENEFDAQIEPTGPGLELRVKYYTHGVHPPHALHSEGHQDSMGLCLYLALAEQVTKDKIDLILLDDVIMSIDSDHRRKICYLLKDQFPNRQFFITTHDKPWYTQLQREKVAQVAIDIHRWTIESGPIIGSPDQSNLWINIEQALQDGRVPQAAHELRRGGEEFFQAVCESLQASLPYRKNANWDIGELMSGAQSRLSSLIKLAKSSANSWDKRELVKTITELDELKVEVYEQVDRERWVVNPMVHYNEWANLTVADFRPAVDAYHKLFDLFICTECKGLLRVVYAGPGEDSVHCPCNSINYSLKKK